MRSSWVAGHFCNAGACIYGMRGRCTTIVFAKQRNDLGLSSPRQGETFALRGTDIIWAPRESNVINTPAGDFSGDRKSTRKEPPMTAFVCTHACNDASVLFCLFLSFLFTWTAAYSELLAGGAIIWCCFSVMLCSDFSSLGNPLFPYYR